MHSSQYYSDWKDIRNSNDKSICTFSFQFLCNLAYFRLFTLFSFLKNGFFDIHTSTETISDKALAKHSSIWWNSSLKMVRYKDWTENKWKKLSKRPKNCCSRPFLKIARRSDSLEAKYKIKWEVAEDLCRALCILMLSYTWIVYAHSF